MEYKSVFYPTEMDLYDALFSNGQKVTHNYLLELAKDRGILLSSEDEREYLANYISLLNHDYFDFKGISSRIARSSRSDKTTSELVKVSVNESNVTEIFKNVEKTRSQKQETYKMTKIDENTTRIEVVYDEIDHSKTKLIQKVRNEAYIDIINTGSEVKIRHTANQRVSDIKDDIVECISKITKKDIQPVVITFEGIRDTTLRTLFFTKLINSIQGYNLENVSKVKLSSKDSISDDEMEEVEGLEDAATCFIKKASYDGDNLLNSPEYKQLEKKGYFITCIKWVSLEKGKNPNKIEMEALFDQPEKGSGYKYSVKGIYKLKNAGYTQLRPVQEDEETPLLSKIETASNKIFQEIIKEEFLKKVN